MLLAGRSIYGSLKQIQEDYSRGWVDNNRDFNSFTHFFSVYVDRGETIRSFDLTDFFPFYIDGDLGSISILYEAANVQGCWIIEKKIGQKIGDTASYATKEVNSLIEVEEFLNVRL